MYGLDEWAQQVKFDANLGNSLDLLFGKKTKKLKFDLSTSYRKLELNYNYSLIPVAVLMRSVH